MTKLEIYNKVSRYTLCSKARTFATIDAVRSVMKRGVPGDFVECGVYRGGQIMAMMLTLNLLKKERQLYLYDTFWGMPRPRVWEKKNKSGSRALDKYERLKREDGSSGWCRAEFEEVLYNIYSIPYNRMKLCFVKGMVEETLLENYHEEIALLRLDTDLYASTKVELEILYPKLQSGGVLIVDDYGHWSGAKKATDEFCKANGLEFCWSWIDGTGIMMVKP